MIDDNKNAEAPETEAKEAAAEVVEAEEAAKKRESPAKAEEPVKSEPTAKKAKKPKRNKEGKTPAVSANKQTKAHNPKSTGNLIPFDQLDPETAHAIRSAGGKASAIARRKRRTMAELAMVMGDSKVKNKTLTKKLMELGLDTEDCTNTAMAVAGVLKAAAAGDIKAFEKWEELAEVKDDGFGRVYHIDLDSVADPFHTIMRDIREHLAADGPCNREYVLPGGRGSCKSSFVSQAICEILKNNNLMHAVVMRKVYNTCLDSVYAQMQWAITEQGMDDEWEAKKQPLSIAYKKTGQTIYFRGADKPEKIKGIKPPFGYIGVLWFEEADQFSGPNEVRKIEQSIKRGGDKFFVFKSYNPPQACNNWMVEYSNEAREDKIVLRTTYKQVPPSWLGKAFLDDAEFLRQKHPAAYAHEYLGESNGTGANIFDNLKIRGIDPDEIENLPHYYGQDWGWYPDPNQFVGCAYDARNMVLYIFEDYRGNKKGNKEWAEVIRKHQNTNEIITADCAEMESIDYFHGAGFRMIPCYKYPGSVREGMKWLQSQCEIVIDPRTAPNAAEEFSHYESSRDKDGNVLGDYPDKNNHTIDAVRYATERLWQRQ